MEHFRHVFRKWREGWNGADKNVNSNGTLYKADEE